MTLERVKSWEGSLFLAAQNGMLIKEKLSSPGDAKCSVSIYPSPFLFHSLPLCLFLSFSLCAKNDTSTPSVMSSVLELKDSGYMLFIFSTS